MTSPAPLRAAIYARVSTFDQEPENQLAELRQYVTARGWSGHEYTDRGISGAKETRPALDALMIEVKRKRVDVVILWSLDRLGRSLRHLVGLLDEFRALDVALVSLREGLDSTTPAGRLMWGIVGAIAEFEKERLRERVLAGLARARASGRRLGPTPHRITAEDLARTNDLSVRRAAAELGIPRSVLHRARVSREPARIGLQKAQ